MPTGFPCSGPQVLGETDSLGLSPLDFRLLHFSWKRLQWLYFLAPLPTGQREVNATLVP